MGTIVFFFLRRSAKQLALVLRPSRSGCRNVEVLVILEAWPIPFLESLWVPRAPIVPFLESIGLLLLPFLKPYGP